MKEFWSEIWTFSRIQGEVDAKEIIEEAGERVLEEYEHMDDFPRWFPQRKLNFAQNLLYNERDMDPDSVAIHFRSEIDSLSRQLTWRELREQVGRMQRVLRDQFGVGKGDRIAAYAPNCPEVLIYMLAGASLGAIFTAGSPDFGPTAIIDRFSQTQPKVLLSCNAVYYNGKIHDHFDKLDEVVDRCGSSLERVLVVDYIRGYEGGVKNERYLSWDDVMVVEDGQVYVAQYEQFDFDLPLYIVYSSGTTGRPKCIVHGAGGSLLQHVKEHLLHGNVGAGDVMMQYTTIGWMMWQWMVSGLAVGATLVLYDGSPFRPDPSRMWKLVEELKVTHFGTSAKYLQSLQDTNFIFADAADMQSLRVIFSTGSPLPADTFRFIYQKCLRGLDVQLASITGGTDILSLFAGGCPILPVYAGEIQVPCLGMALGCNVPDRGIVPFECNWEGRSEICGDLVCFKPFPSQPVSFWLDDPVKREKYRAAYFSDPSCPRIWHHGDYLCFCAETGGLLMLGRSDGTLNPAGVRFGSADLYAICGDEKNSKWIADSLAVGVKLDEWKDEQVFLFLLLKPGVEAAVFEDRVDELRNQIKAQLSPRHVPAHIHPVPSIPHTLNGKKVEVSVKRILNGNFDLEVLNLADPGAVHFYREFGRELHAGKHVHNNNKL